MGSFIDGTRVTPGTQSCNCQPECEFPCWQRIGWAPACSSCKCPPFPDTSEEDSYVNMLEEIKPDDTSS